MPSLVNLPPSSQHPTALDCHRALGSDPCVTQQIPLALCFTYSSVDVSMLLSQFVPPSPSHTASTSLFSMSSSPLLPCRFFSTIFLDPIHTISLSVSELLHSIQQALCSSTSLGLTQVSSFLKLRNIPSREHFMQRWV